MKSKISKIVIILILIISVNLIAVPGTINFQGALKDANGVPVNDTQTIIFRIYDSLVNGILLWNEDTTVVISDGIFSEELGVSSPFPPDLFDNSELYLTFFVEGSEMTPRQKLLAVPYAFRAENTDRIENVPLSRLVQQDGDGNATITGTMTANDFAGDGSGLTGISGDDLGNHTASENVQLDGHWLSNDGGDEGVFVSSAGEVGIGLSNPSEKLDIIGKVHATDGFTVTQADLDGVYVSSAGDDGFNVYYAGNPSTQLNSTFKNGFEVAGAEGHGLFVGRADLDGVSVNSAGDDGVYVYRAGNPSTQLNSTFKNGFEVAGAEGNGLHVGRAEDDGVFVNSAGDDGVYVYHAGTPTTQTISASKNGFEVAGAAGHGLYVGRAEERGVYVQSAGGHGVHVGDVGEDGVYVGIAGADGVCISNAGHNGVYVSNAGYNGVFVANAGNYGVFANTSVTNGYGFITYDRIHGSNVTSRSQSTHVRYVGNEILESGDLVCIAGGYQENVLGEDDLPVVNVTKANSSNSEAIVGVVEYKVYVREDTEDVGEGNTEIQKSFRYAEGSASRGDYLSIIVFGLVDVNVDSRADIKIGEKMTVSVNGDARSINDEDDWRIGILGKALENSNGKGKIKVYVNCK